ncbi:hypothetical protein FHX41_4181 [Actinomadura hallensis]|uniref:Secreted protein n=1 Tax=Actinomadura hallensis TaxID=337895 RepID=A0A543IIP6_9ACTN|nr:hypothetical protein [Actinomadura hallensis]TQM70455.1 hypothetical protein FHX41_4181 [Actinomadura hallensis]HLV73776.1 hypothetical protein [Vulgatibacteraceae bacterium]
MRRALSYVAPWAGVTALAVALSWLGVRGVVRDAVSERSSPPPAAGPVIRSSPPFPTSVGSPTSLPEPPAGEDSAPKPSPSPKVPPGGGDEPAKSSPSRKPRDNVRSYTTRGGRAAMSVGKDRVRLVSATPNPGYETRVTQAGGWLRVDFLDDDHTSSVIATWADGDPAVKVYEY